MATTEVQDGLSRNGQLLKSTTATARVCDLVEMDVSIYGRTVITVHDEDGEPLFSAELGPASYIKVTDADARR